MMLVSFCAVDVPVEVQAEVMRLLAPYDPDIWERATVPALRNLDRS